MSNFKILECTVHQTILQCGATYYEIDKDFLDYVNSSYAGEKIQIVFDEPVNSN